MDDRVVEDWEVEIAQRIVAKVREVSTQEMQRLARPAPPTVS